MANKKITDLMSGTPVRDSLLESAIDISGTMDSRKVKAGAVADLASVNVAAPYDSTVTYAIGQYCLYEGDIYRCIAITTGAFDATAWVQIVVTGEFRRVVELTSAQYSALSSAEKNNGTLYVITDEETTAADIEYTSGVSVADKLDSLNVQTIEITPNTTVASGFDYLVQKSGHVVTYFISCQLQTAISATGTVIVTGMPTPTKNTQIPVVALSGANAGQTNQMAIMTDGKFQTRYTSTTVYPSGAYILAFGSYMTND